MAYSAVDVARYVVNYSHDIGKPVSNLKLQKILYYLQGYFFGYKNRTLFDDKIEAWALGPVVRSVYLEFCGHGGLSIPKVTSVPVHRADRGLEFDDTIDLFETKPYEDVIKPADAHLIRELVRHLSDYSATALVDATHSRGPWKDYYREGLKVEIPMKAIEAYFKSIAARRDRT
ncbi:MAG: DUF4065 domain-containing protein [Bacillota bacterium]|nr:DUF4065 domain-containing protein [Bacillota bacterium]